MIGRGSGTRRFGARSVVPLAALASIHFGCARSREVPTETVVVVPLVQTVEVTGELKAVDSVPVRPPGLVDYGGDFKIASLASDGAEVAAGDPILGFDPTEVSDKLESLQNEAQKAQKALDKRRLELDMERQDQTLRIAEAHAWVRRATLKASGGEIAGAALQQRQLQMDKTAADLNLQRWEGFVVRYKRWADGEIARVSGELAAARRKITIAEENLKKLTVTAPRAGTVVLGTEGDGKLKVGSSVWRMETVLEVVVLDSMAGAGVIDEADIAKVKPGMPVTLRTDALPDVVLRGTVKDMDRGVRDRSRTDPSRVIGVELEISGKADRRLRPGMRFVGQIEVGKVENATVIPPDAVYFTDGKAVAYRWTKDREEAVPLTLGLRTKKAVQVVTGLSAGDRVRRRDELGQGRP